MLPEPARAHLSSVDVAEIDAALAWAGGPQPGPVRPSEEVVIHANEVALRRAEHLRPVRELPGGARDLDPRSYARLLLLTTALPAIDVVAHVRELFAMDFADAVVVTCAALT